MQIYVADLHGHKISGVSDRVFDLNNYNDFKELELEILGLIVSTKSLNIDYQVYESHSEKNTWICELEYLNRLFDIYNALKSHDEMIVSGAIELGIRLDDIKNAYYGSFSQDELHEFLQELGFIKGLEGREELSHFDSRGFYDKYIQESYPSYERDGKLHIFNGVY
jgi:hypothetical protein